MAVNTLAKQRNAVTGSSMKVLAEHRKILDVGGSTDLYSP